MVRFIVLHVVDKINKMDKSWHCCVLLLVTVLAASCSVAEVISKSVCLGESIQLFQNITLASFKISANLYKIGAGRKEPIAILFPIASENDAHILDLYKSKLLFQNGVIMLRNVQLSDEATYAILSDGQSEGEEEQIKALAPPAKPCKPKLKQVANFLTASIDNPDCYGRPAASVYWMGDSGISNKNKTVILKLQGGKGVCTYYACIDGEALKCARNTTLRDYCENITAEPAGEDNKPTPSSATPQSTTHIWIIIPVIIVFMVIFIVTTYFNFLWKRYISPRIVCSEAKRTDQRSSQVQIDDDDETEDYET